MRGDFRVLAAGRQHTDVRPLHGVSRRSIGAVAAMAFAMAASLLFHVHVSFWRDESTTATLATRTPSQLLRLFGHEEGGYSGYLLFMRAWTVLGHGEAVFRLPSLIAGVVAILGVGYLAMRLGGSLAGILGAAVLTLHPHFMPKYAIDARPYAMCAAFVVCAAAIALELSRREVRFGLTAWSVLSSLAIAFHVLTLLAVVPQLIWLLVAAVRRPEQRRRIVLAAVLPAVTAVVLVVLALIVSIESSLPEISFSGTATVIGRMVSPVVAALGIAVAIAVVISTGAAARNRVRSPLAAVDAVTLAVWAVLPCVALFTVSLVGSPIFTERYMLSSAAALSVLVGVGGSWVVGQVRALPSASRRAVAGAVLVVGAGVGITANIASGALRYEHKGEDLRGATQWIQDRRSPSDDVVYMPGWSELGMRWYVDELRPPIADITAMGGTSAAIVAEVFNPSVGLGEAQRRLRVLDRVFVVGYPDNETWHVTPDFGPPLTDEIHRCWTLIDEDHDDFGITVQLWQRPATGC